MKYVHCQALTNSKVSTSEVSYSFHSLSVHCDPFKKAQGWTGAAVQSSALVQVQTSDAWSVQKAKVKRQQLGTKTMNFGWKIQIRAHVAENLFTGHEQHPHAPAQASGAAPNQE